MQQKRNEKKEKHAGKRSQHRREGQKAGDFKCDKVRYICKMYKKSN